MANKLILGFATLMLIQVSSALFFRKPAQSPILTEIQVLRNLLAQFLANDTALNATAANTTATNTTATNTTATNTTSPTQFKPICHHLLNHLNLFGNGTVPLLPNNVFLLSNVFRDGLRQLGSIFNGTRTTHPLTNLFGGLNTNILNFLRILQQNAALAG